MIILYNDSTAQVTWMEREKFSILVCEGERLKPRSRYRSHRCRLVFTFLASLFAFVISIHLFLFRFVSSHPVSTGHVPFFSCLFRFHLASFHLLSTCLSLLVSFLWSPPSCSFLILFLFFPPPLLVFCLLDFPVFISSLVYFPRSSCYLISSRLSSLLFSSPLTSSCHASTYLFSSLQFLPPWSGAHLISSLYFLIVSVLLVSVFCPCLMSTCLPKELASSQFVSSTFLNSSVSPTLFWYSLHASSRSSGSCLISLSFLAFSSRHFFTSCLIFFSVFF